MDSSRPRDLILLTTRLLGPENMETLINAGGGAFFLNEAYQLALRHYYGGASVLNLLLAETENQVGKTVFVFAGYNKQMEKFFKHSQGFSSWMP